MSERLGDLWTRAIHQAVEQQMGKIAEEEIAAATAKIEERMREMLAGIVLRLMSQYEVRQMENRIVIEVRNRPAQGG